MDEFTERRMRKHFEGNDLLLKDKYILDGQRIARPSSYYDWVMWYEQADRRVARTCLGRVEVSTVFLGMDHNWWDKGEPILFETMIFGGPQDQEMWRYRTWEEAEQGHADVVAQVGAFYRRIARYDALRERTPRSALPKRAPFRRAYAPKEFRA